jgi:hypothetical protein
MKGTHELGSSTTRRRFAAGLVGGFAALAIGAAPIMHDSASLDIDIDIVDYGYADPDRERLNEDETAPDIDVVEVDLTNHGGAFVPLWISWDQKRKTRHNWLIDEGPIPVGSGKTARYRLVAPGEDGRINAGYPAQITVFEKGEQRWKSIQFTSEPSTEESR